MKNKTQYFYNALLLTAVSLVMRTVSVSFNVYVSNRVGAEAMGLLSLVSGVYGFAVTLATSGINLATVRLLSQRLERGGGSIWSALRACLTYAAFFGFLSSALLFAFARPLGTLVLKDTRTIRALYVLSATLLPIALCSVMNGYFTAMRRAWKSAVIQILEQSAKIGTTIYLLLFAAPKTVEGCLLAILLGGVCAELLSLLLNLLLFALDRKGQYLKKAEKAEKCTSVRAIALPVAISAYVRSGLLAIEHILIPRGLLRFGSGNSEALSAYGALHSMALPVVLYPAAILSSFASLLIPEVTKEQSLDNRVQIRYITGRVYQVTLLFSIGAAGIMLCHSSELGNALYQSKEVGEYIAALAPLIPIMYLDTCTDAMLKGLGEQVYSMRVNILDALTSVICVAIFVPRIGIAGYLLTIYITEVLNAVLSVTRLLRITGFSPSVIRLILRPLAAVIGATSLARLLQEPLWASGIKAAPFHICITALFYLFLLVALGGFGKSEMHWLGGFLIKRPQKNDGSLKDLCEKP